MKLAICLAFFAITSFVASQATTDPNFLLSRPWTSTGSNPADVTNAECCVPQGTINFYSSKYDGSYVYFNATQWTGALCYDLSMIPELEIDFPFANTSSYNQLVASGTQNFTWDGSNLMFSVGNYAMNSENGAVSWDLTINYTNTTFANAVACTVTLANYPDYDSDSDFLTSYTWQTNGTFPANLANADCCMPEGTITFVQDTATGEVSLNATQWSGELCADLGNIDMIFPFSNTSSYNDMYELAQTSPQDLIFTVGNLSKSRTVFVSWTMEINFEQSLFEGGICSVTLSGVFDSDYTDSDSDFFFAHPWQANGTSPNLANADCCMPEGTVTFVKNTTTGEIYLNATKWSGELCADLSNIDMIFPFSNSSLVNDFFLLPPQTSPQDLIFTIGYYSSSTTEFISWSMNINFEQSLFEGGECGVTLTTAFESDPVNFIGQFAYSE